MNIRVSNKILPAEEINAFRKKLFYVNHDLKGDFGLNELRLFQLLKMGYTPLSRKQITEELEDSDVIKNKLRPGERTFGRLYAFSGNKPFAETAIDTCECGKFRIEKSLAIPEEFRHNPFTLLALDRFYEGGNLLVNIEIKRKMSYEIDIVDAGKYRKLVKLVDSPSEEQTGALGQIREAILAAFGNDKQLPAPRLQNVTYKIILSIKEEALQYFKGEQIHESSAKIGAGTILRLKIEGLDLEIENPRKVGVGFLRTRFDGSKADINIGHANGIYYCPAVLEKVQ